jgi:hypothetical protein
MIGHLIVRCSLAAAMGAALFAPAHAADGGLQGLIAAQQAVDAAAASAQKEVDALDESTHNMLNEYRQTLESVRSIASYNGTLSGLVGKQREEIAGLQADLASIETTNREVYPLMARMVDTLAQFVSLDLPFLFDERTKRVNRLREILGRSDVTVSEKYRQVLEAYQIELEFGRTIDAYDGTLGEGDAGKAVTFLRIGRVALLYQTADASQTGYWDRNSKSWVEDAAQAENVREGIRVAKKLGAPELLNLPVPAPQGDQ